MQSGYSTHGQGVNFYSSIYDGDKIELRLQIELESRKIVGNMSGGSGDDTNRYYSLEFEDLEAMKEMAEFLVRLCIVTELSR